MPMYKGISFHKTEMLYIVHGNDYSKSRKLIINQQKKLSSQNKTEIDLAECTPKKLFELINSFDIFGNPPFVVLKIPTTKVFDMNKYIEVMTKIPKDSLLIILAEGNLSKSNEVIKNASKLKAKISHNEKIIQANIFKFVDQLMIRNKKTAYAELHKLIEEDTDPFYILSMVMYGIRNVATAKEPSESFEKKSPYVKIKATAQASNFDRQEILDLYSFIYKLEKSLKTGQISPDLVIPYVIEKISNL
ncbi:hypothetical protein ACFL0C_02135 [Patescibacteria group bacterium]